MISSEILRSSSTRANLIWRTFSRNLLRSNRRSSTEKPVDYAVCIDIECTCDHPVQIFPMEVIEIACSTLDLKVPSKVIKSSESRMFHSFVKPEINPELTLFCQELTGILQPTVEKAETISKVTGHLLRWLQRENLIDENFVSKERFAFASCGNFDLKLLSPIFENQQFNNNFKLPIYFKEWINVKKTFVNHKGEWPKGLYHMMELLGEEPSGRLHSAKDDCRNLARVVECLHLEGCKFFVTNKVNKGPPRQAELRDL